MGLKRLSRLPSEYLKEHAHWGFWDDLLGVDVRHRIGVDRIMWSTDFPHIVIVGPKSKNLVQEQFVGRLNIQHAMLAGNAVKFFHLNRK